MRAHFWTIYPRLRHHLAGAPDAVATEPWEGVVADPQRGPVGIRGLLRRPPGSRACVVLVHGLGGTSQSPYVQSAAATCEALGLATLRLGLRGSDGTGTDIYHAGLTVDVATALGAPELAAFESLYLLGFSLGGHVVLRHAAEAPAPRLRSVAAVCAPLDLAAAQRGFDRPACWPYRTYVLRRLKVIYAAIAQRAPVPTPVAEVSRVTSLRDWDQLTVVPRFGFADADDYYARASVAPLLPLLAVPALLVASPGDPMVSRESIAGAAAAAAGRLRLCWVDGGGHVGFPPGVDFGAPGPPGLESQLVHWLVDGAEGYGGQSTGSNATATSSATSVSGAPTFT